MFLASELSTQTVQYTTGLERERALFVGSAMSGYATGFLAASFNDSRAETYEPWVVSLRIGLKK